MSESPSTDSGESGPTTGRSPLTEPSEERVEHRATLLPEEDSAGSDDAHRQAQIILEDSDARTEDPQGTAEDSSQTPDYPR